MWPEPVERVARELRAAAVDVTIEEFPEGTPTAEAAARAIGCRLDADRQVDPLHRATAGRSSRSSRATGGPNEELVAAAAEAEEVRVAKRGRGARRDRVTSRAPSRRSRSGRSTRCCSSATILQHDQVWIGAGSPAHMAGLAPEELAAPFAGPGLRIS